jgi:hypothetical protein
MGIGEENPETFLAPGFLIDSTRYARSAITVSPLVNETDVPLRPFHEGPIPPPKFEPWHEAQPLLFDNSKPSTAEGERSVGVVEAADPQALRPRPRPTTTRKGRARFMRPNLLPSRPIKDGWGIPEKYHRSRGQWRPRCLAQAPHRP